MKATVYKLTTGVISKAIEGAEDIIRLNIGPDETMLAAEAPGDIDDYLVVDGGFQKKPNLPITVTGSTIHNIPSGTEVLAPGEAPFVTDGGSITFAGKFPQTILVSLIHPQYLPASVTVTI